MSDDLNLETVEGCLLLLGDGHDVDLRAIAVERHTARAAASAVSAVVRRPPRLVPYGCTSTESHEQHVHGPYARAAVVTLS